ncbi:MAG: hypothetical protein BTN85_1729 [Candidatus Methanohalarchaeum thermophilum]|uniref:Uncharacterized protein n=1 Tax=Methanohalarchaeum thermophilum TaxID=1903181 RepID=A0A1Q6DXZ8_METT1|nr:MAG: hypothetical protein BTN85_1729 [Candidatus Methanohalarchaeum thermophilum]
MIVPASTSTDNNWTDEEIRFAITPKYIKKEMKGTFKNTLLILDSCHTFTPESDYKLIKTFYQKKAKAVI